MTVSADRPQVWHQLCFNADPNDTSAVPVWVDYTALVRKIGLNRRGALYELAQSQAAQPPIMWRDPDEILNPDNTESPQYPFVQPYRQVLSQAMWPNPEAAGGLGADVNLLNSDRWKPNNDVAADPSFESYANGATLPGWLTAVGATVPTVTTTNPQQGTKSLTYAVTSSTTRQGVSWDVACVPGQEYTSSAYVRQSSASTQALLVAGQTLAYSYFLVPTSNGWGSATSGQAWTTTGGSASDYSTLDGFALQSNGTVNTLRHSYLSAGTPDHEIYTEVTIPVLPAGGSITTRVAMRLTDTSNYYEGQMLIGISGSVTTSIRRRVAGAGAAVSADVVLTQSHKAGDTWSIRAGALGSALFLKIWKTSTPEPEDWTATGTDTSLTTGNNVGMLSRLESGNTNTLPVVISWAKAMVTGMLSSSTTTTTGSYVRLSRTWTATQPLHTIQLSTVGTAVAGTVNIDALQHEIGASASTFTTSGPIIYPWQRLYIERWPRAYQASGFVGVAKTPAVDGFAALNAIDVLPEYDAAVLASRPAYYWLLSGGAETTQSLETSGNNGPSLLQFESKYGPGVLPQFGTSIDIPGAAGTTGVLFTRTASGGFGTGTMLSAGRVATAPGILFPSAYASTWSASISAWARVDDDVNFQGGFIVAFAAAAQGDFIVAPISIAGATFGDGFPDFGITVQGNGSGASATSPVFTLLVGQTYHIVGTVTQVSGGDTTISLYINGELVDTTVVTTASLGGLFTTPANYVNVGGGSFGGQNMPGVLSRVVLWERALSASEVTALWTAGGLGNASETTGERLERHLSDGRYAGATRISTTYTTLSAPTNQGAIDGLTDAQNLALAEAGRLWCAPDGALVLESRYDRWLRYSTVAATFGEDEAGGEVPYGPGIEFDYDPTFVYADVRITRNNGSVAVGGLAAEIAEVARKFFPRSYAIGCDFETDTEAQYYADYVFYTHRAPLMRVSAITITPAANPSLWPVALSLEVGQRVTVKRRAKAANSGVGLAMSADYFIEAVIIHEIDFDKWDFRVSFLLSPIGTVPGPTFQPWILENATYGVLDSTTILGW